MSQVENGERFRGGIFARSWHFVKSIAKRVEWWVWVGT